jgi:hypothetical protein
MKCSFLSRTIHRFQPPPKFRDMWGARAAHLKIDVPRVRSDPAPFQTSQPPEWQPASKCSTTGMSCSWIINGIVVVCPLILTCNLFSCCKPRYGLTGCSRCPVESVPFGHWLSYISLIDNSHWKDKWLLCQGQNMLLSTCRTCLWYHQTWLGCR